MRQIRCPRCKGLFYSLQNHFCSIPADWEPRKVEMQPGESR